MAVSKMTCPECGATLKFGQPVSAGKRIKCPKCKSSFVVPEEEEEAPPPPKPVAAKPPSAGGDDEDEEGGAYGVREREQEAKPDKKKKSVFEEPMRDRFPKSKRGPAQAAVIPPSNGLMGAGILTCIFYLAMMVATIFPVIFSSADAPVTTKRAAAPAASGTARSAAPTASENPAPQSKNGMTGERWGYLLMYGLLFGVGAVITGGATKMQNLESLNWAAGASLLALVPVPLVAWAMTGELWKAFPWVLTLPAGLWCALTLKRAEVRAGYTVPRRPRREPTE